jgi:hypothetical protein
MTAVDDHIKECLNNWVAVCQHLNNFQLSLDYIAGYQKALWEVKRMKESDDRTT